MGSWAEPRGIFAVAEANSRARSFEAYAKRVRKGYREKHRGAACERIWRGDQ